MRRSDREIKDIDEIIEVIKKCDVCRLALNDEEGYPYILPLNFGMQIEKNEKRNIEGEKEKEKIVLYFHGAVEGKKYELMRRDNRASFEMDCAHRLITDEEHGNCTMEYESVIGRGKMEILPDEEKRMALKVLMKHYHKEDFIFNEAVIPQTVLFKLTVENVTGKRRMKKNK